VWVIRDSPRGPFQVVERQRDFFRVMMGDQVETVSTSRLKPAWMPLGVQHATPPARGRPKRMWFAKSGQSPPEG
jgi:hypothetical protein